MNLNYLLSEENGFSVAYAVCYIDSQKEQKNLLMKVGSDDQAKVYLNGQQIYRRLQSRPLIPDHDTVRGGRLKAGLNVLVFKIVNETDYWGGAIRFTDPADHPLEGIEVTLDPGDMDGP